MRTVSDETEQEEIENLKIKTSRIFLFSWLGIKAQFFVESIMPWMAFKNLECNLTDSVHFRKRIQFDQKCLVPSSISGSEYRHG